MKKIFILVSLFWGMVFFAAPVQAGSCTYSVTSLSWTGQINSGVNVRDLTCMDSTVLATVPGGTSVNIVGEADGWYQLKLSDGTKGFVWHTFVTVTSKDSNAGHKISNEYTKGKDVTAIKSEVKKVVKEPATYKKSTTTTELSERVKGYILLQVESVGEAWYVHPDDGRRYYMKDGGTAYEMMRFMGLGVSNVDMAKIQKGEVTLINRLKGKIVLQVELHGEAYYISPKDGSVHYLKNGAEAYRIMRELSLGITNKDLNSLVSKDFDTYKKEKESGILSQEGSITLSASQISAAIYSNGSGKVSLSWVVDGVNTSKGFKVVKSFNQNPVYPGDNYHYLSDSVVRSDVWNNLASGVYHFRVCQYLGGACGVYSNDVAVTVGSSSTPVAETTPISESSNSIVPSTSQEGIIPVGVDMNELNQYWLSKINNLRAKSGLRLLVLDQRWVDTATEWASYMGVNDQASHDRADGKSMHQWIDTKGLPFTERYSVDGWATNYFTENIAWGLASSGTTASVKTVLDDTLAFYLSEVASNGSHYRTIYHQDWNSVGIGLHFTLSGSGYKVYVAMHYGSLVL